MGRAPGNHAGRQRARLEMGKDLVLGGHQEDRFSISAPRHDCVTSNAEFSVYEMPTVLLYLILAL